MTPGSRLAAAVLLAAALTSCTSVPESGQTSTAPTGSADAATPIVTPVLVDVVAEPVPMPATDGRVHLVYELLLTNTSPEPVTVDSVAVMGPAGPLLQLSGAGLGYWTRTMGTRASTNDLAPGQCSIVWLDVKLDAGSAVPQQLSHRVVVKVPKPMPPLVPPVVTENVAPVTVSDRKPVVLDPPLRGSGWLDANGCCDMTPTRSTESSGLQSDSPSTTSSFGPTGSCSAGTAGRRTATSTSDPTCTPSRTAPWSRSSTACPSRCPASTRPASHWRSTAATTSSRTSGTETSRSTRT
jgi:hypothetical protein